MKKGPTLIEWAIVLAMIVIFVSFFAGFFASEEKAVKALENSGFSDVKVTDRAVFFLSFRGGSNSDNYRFTATARNPIGQEVEVYVFGSWPFKAPTIRAKVD